MVKVGVVKRQLFLILCGIVGGSNPLTWCLLFYIFLSSKVSVLGIHFVCVGKCARCMNSYHLRCAYVCATHIFSRLFAISFSFFLSAFHLLLARKYDIFTFILGNWITEMCLVLTIRVYAFKCMCLEQCRPAGKAF